MAQEIHRFELQTVWTGDSDGSGTAHGGDGWDLAYGRPTTLGGAGGRANPEELLLSAVVSCYCITLAVLAERKRVPLERIEITADAEVERQLGGTLKYNAIHMKPVLHSPGADDAQVTSLTDAAHKAEVYCVISNAIRGNVEVTIEPTVMTSNQ